MTLNERLEAKAAEQSRDASRELRYGQRLPEWRRRMEERLAKSGRVAEKALDR